MHHESGACEHGLEGFGRAERSEHGRPHPWHPRGSIPQERARKQSATGETLYMDELFERRSDPDGENAKSIFHVGAIGRTIAQVTFEASDQSEAVTYLHTDQQGSIRLVTGGGGSVALAVRHYGPFGELVDAAGESSAIATEDVRFGYTGHEHDTELGLINMRGRIFDPVLRGFLTPDPIVPDAFDTESYNPYAYVRNNPLRFVDPSGFEAVDCAAVTCDVFYSYRTPAAAHGMTEEEWGKAVQAARADVQAIEKFIQEGTGFERPEGVTREQALDQARTRLEELESAPIPLAFSAGMSSPNSETSPGPTLTTGAVINWTETFAATKRAGDFISRVANGQPVGEAYTESGLTGWDVAVATAGLVGPVVAAIRSAGTAAKAGAQVLPKGGVYALRNAEGVVVRTGRTKDLARRAAEHLRDPATKDFTFETLYRTDVYAAQRGLEQFVHNLRDPLVCFLQGEVAAPAV